MTQSPENLEFERLVAEAVGKHVNATSVKMDDRPDATLVVDGQSFGVEVVSTVENGWVKAKILMEELRPKIEAELQNRGLYYLVEYEIEVPEHFPYEEQLSGRDRKKWAAALPAKLAELAAQGPADFNRAQLEERGITKLVQAHVRPRVRALALPGYWWSSAPPATLAEALLRSKEGKLPGYRAAIPDASGFWLAIAPFGPGTPENGFGWLMDGEYATTFDRVFLVNPNDGGQVWDVTPASRRASK